MKGGTEDRDRPLFSYSWQDGPLPTRWVGKGGCLPHPAPAPSWGYGPLTPRLGCLKVRDSKDLGKALSDFGFI